MKQKHVAETADELLRMVAPVRSTSDPTPSVSGVLVLREHSHADEREGELHENGCECGGTADPELCLRAGCERRAAK